MKKLLALLLTFVLVFSLFACTSLDSFESDEDDEEAEEKEEKKKVTIEETVIYDENDVTITATSFSFKEGKSTAKLELEITNNRSGAITITDGFISLNGLLVEAYWYCEVEAGKTVTDEIEFSDLDELDITLIQSIALQLTGYDPSTYETQFISDSITLHTSAYDDDSYVQKFNDDGKLLYEDENVRVVVLGISDSDYYYKTVDLFIENKSSSPWSLYAMDELADGHEITTTFFSTIPAGMKCYDRIGIDQDALTDAGIESIETLQCQLVISNGDYENYNSYRSPTVTIDFN